MKQGQDITAQFPGVLIIHQKIRGNTVGTHQHEEHELFIPLQGEIQIQVPAKNQLLTGGPGKMIYLPPHTDHSFQSNESAQGERLILFVEDKFWKSSEAAAHEACATSVSQLCKELLFHLLIYPKTKAAKPLLNTLLITLSEMLEASANHSISNASHLGGKTSDARIQKALTIISKKYNATLTIDELAKSAGLSTRNLNRLFLEELTLTPKQVITLHRVDRAKHLLSQGQLSVTDVAFEVGYQSVSQFITTFRTLTGQLPSSFTR